MSEKINRENATETWKVSRLKHHVTIIDYKISTWYNSLSFPMILQ